MLTLTIQGQERPIDFYVMENCPQQVILGNSALSLFGSSVTIDYDAKWLYLGNTVLTMILDTPTTPTVAELDLNGIVVMEPMKTQLNQSLLLKQLPYHQDPVKEYKFV